MLDVVFIWLCALPLHGIKNSLHAFADDQTQSNDGTTTSTPVRTVTPLQLNISDSPDNSQRASLASAEDLTDSAEASDEEDEESDEEDETDDDNDNDYVVVDSEHEV